MDLVEIQKIKKSNKYFAELDHLCFLSKNLYNATLYTVRQHYFNTKEYMSYLKVNELFRRTEQQDYRALPAKVSAWVQKLVEQDFKSFVALLKQKATGLYDRPVHLPRYADKINGRKKLHYDKQALSFQRKGFVKLSKTDIYIKTDKDVRYVEVVPCGNYYKIIVGYQVKESPTMHNDNIASIDLGVNNLAVVCSNVMKPFIVNGKPLKSINQYANKRIAHYQSMLQGGYTSKRIQRIWGKRNDKVNDYLHKASTYVVNQLVSNKISTLVVGYNEGWKQDTDMGKRNNQNFVQIPFKRFIDLLTYKCSLRGITVVLQEESYTSKCSFLDNEPICKQSIYMGRRVQRGLFRASTGKFINADLNGSLNILRKRLEKKVAWNTQIWVNLVEVCSTPNLQVITCK